MPVIIWTVKDTTAEQRAVLRASAHSVMAKASGGAGLVTELARHLPPSAGRKTTPVTE